MGQMDLQLYQFTIDAAIAEWLAQKERRTNSHKTRAAYEETMRDFRAFLALGPLNLDLLDNPVDIARVAPVWANGRADGTKRPGTSVSPATYNQRLAIVSSFYTFVNKTYRLDPPLPNPIALVEKRPQQALEAALPLEVEMVAEGLDRIDRGTPQGMRDYALLAVALYTGRRATELVSLRWRDVQITGKKEPRVTLTFLCKGGKVKRDQLDAETSAVLLQYLHAEHGKNLRRLAPDTPVWRSYSRANAGQSISAKTLSNICAAYLDTSKTHALRHTFAVEGEKVGMPISEISDRMGHSDEKITSRYLKQKRSAVNPYGEKLAAHLGIKRKANDRTR